VSDYDARQRRRDARELQRRYPGRFPAPGMQGDYTEACVVCLSGTDTAVCVQGEPEFIAAAMHQLGVPLNDVPGTLSATMECEPGMVLDGWHSIVIRVCRTCAERSGATIGLLTPGRLALPTYRQPDEDAGG
jgi:hypothetical protein